MSFKPYKNDSWAIRTGQDFREVIVVRDPTQPKIKNPDYDKCDPDSPQYIYPEKDLTGYGVVADIREKADSNSDLIHHFEVGNGVTITGGAIEFFIDSTVTDASPIADNKGKSGYYDIFLIPPGPQDNVCIVFGSIPNNDLKIHKRLFKLSPKEVMHLITITGTQNLAAGEIATVLKFDDDWNIIEETSPQNRIAILQNDVPNGTAGQRARHYVMDGGTNSDRFYGLSSTAGGQPTLFGRIS